MLSVFCNQIVDDCTTGNHHEFGFFKSNDAFGFVLGMTYTTLIAGIRVKFINSRVKTRMQF